MNQSTIDRSVARATGESRRTISRLGFSLLGEPDQSSDDVAIACECGGCGHVIPIRPKQLCYSEPEAECVRCDALYPVTPDELFAVSGPLMPLAHSA